jgi:RNA polymerase sigma-70 factor (ECF subfamily)
MISLPRTGDPIADPLSSDSSLLADAFQRHRRRLVYLVRSRLSGRLRNRLDPCDVLQEAFLRAGRNLQPMLGSSPVSEYVRVRRLTLCTLIELQRRHLGVQARNVRKELDLGDQDLRAESIARQAADCCSLPHSFLERLEESVRVQQALAQLEPMDREILVLRCGEQLTRAQVAQALGISVAAAAKRYVRALARCRRVMVRMGLERQ